ncbi:MAG: hypothetical protein JKY88_07835 [Pseudomonadales bacterium]|nr:hypothetical protein [Pseudomonadales bacterium]
MKILLVIGFLSFCLSAKGVGIGRDNHFTSLMEISTNITKRERNYAALLSGTDIIGVLTNGPTEAESQFHKSMLAFSNAHLSLLKGNVSIFNDYIGKQGLNDDFKSPSFLKGMIYVFTDSVAANVPVVRADIFRKRLEAGNFILPKNDQVIALASLYYIESKPIILGQLLDNIEDYGMSVTAYVSWLNSRLSPTDFNVNKAVSDIERAIGERKSNNRVNFTLDVHLADSYVRQFRLWNTQELASTEFRIKAIADGLVLEGILKELRKETDVIDYPLLFAFHYEILAELYDALALLSNDNQRVLYENKRELAEEIAYNFR